MEQLSSQEVDHLQRSTKRIKDGGHTSPQKLLSYKDTMLQHQKVCTEDVRYTLQHISVNEESDNEEVMDNIPTVKLRMKKGESRLLCPKLLSARPRGEV